MRVQFLLLAVAACANAAAIPATHLVHEKREHTPARWVKRDRLTSRDILPMRVGLKQRNLEKGYDLLMEVSHPGSSNYAKHWTSDEVIDMFKPSEQTVSEVKTWLVASGIAEYRITHTDNQAWFAFDATATEAEALLHTEFFKYEHTTSGQKSAACEQYHVPAHIQEHVDFISPGIKLLAPSGHSRAGKPSHSVKRAAGMINGIPQLPKSRYMPPNVNLSSLDSCDQIITPLCIAALYQFPQGTKADPSNAMGIFEDGDYYAQADLNSFFAKFQPRIPLGTHPKPAFIDGAEAPVPTKYAGGESDLDFELAYPILWPQGTVLYQTDDLPYASGLEMYGGGFNTFLDGIDGSYCTYSAFGETGDDPILDPIYPDLVPGGYLGPLQCGVYKPTNVISVSYGGQEYDLPEYYQKRQCNEFMKLGLQGTSILFASGDSGVAGPNGDDNKNGCLGPNGTIFSPTWPNNCPYITNVGATKVYPNMTVYQPESAVVDPPGHPYRSAFSSGGGFSNIYPVPHYQHDAVHTFFHEHSPPYKYYRGAGNSSFGANGGIYHREGRGIPDVAAVGDNIATFVGGNYTLEGGTSASTPIFASLINRINEERIAIGKKPVGFLNPTLYAHPEILNDITNGTNPGCGTVGFSAVKGWDPVTGLGTPNYPKMLSLFMSLP